jgi:hypothetical protein
MEALPHLAEHGYSFIREILACLAALGGSF